MLTPMQIRDKEFRSAGRNTYRADEVDSFFDEVASSYEQMFKENSELVKRVSLLAERLDQYKKDEDSIKSAVLTAQRAADKIVREATEQADIATKEAYDILAAAKSEASVIRQDTVQSVRAELADSIETAKKRAQELIDKAKSEANDIIIEAQATAKDVQGAANRTITSESFLYDMLKKEVSEFKTELMSKYKMHIELISQLPELAEKKAKGLEKADDISNSVVIQNDTAEESHSEEAVLQNEPEAISENDDGEACDCENLEFDTSDAEIEFINDVDKLDGVVSIDEFVAKSAPIITEAPLTGNVPEIVLNTDIPFSVDDSVNELKFVDDFSENNSTNFNSVDVNDFIESFEEKPEGASEVKKRGFKVNVSRVSETSNNVDNNKEAFFMPDIFNNENSDNNAKGSADDSANTFFDSRTTTGFKLKRPVQNVDSIDDTLQSENSASSGNIFSDTKNNELKNKFSVIRFNDTSVPSAQSNTEAEDYDDNDDDDDDDDSAPSHRKFFKKKK